MNVDPRLDDLRALLGPEHVRADDATRLAYGRDWTRLYAPDPLAIVFPADVEMIRRLVLWARRTRTPLVPSGGRTGLSGGAVAGRGEVVVSLDRLDRLGPVNVVDRTVRAGAGVAVARVQAAAADAGLLYPIDFAPAAAMQVGGNVATNAGGVRVVRYGSTRQWVASLLVVTGAGDVLELGCEAVKDNTGYDLRGLVVGSEGTLAIVAEATLRLAPRPRAATLVAVAAADANAMLRAAAIAAAHGPLLACEFLDRAAIELALAATPEARATPDGGGLASASPVPLDQSRPTAETVSRAAAPRNAEAPMIAGSSCTAAPLAWPLRADAAYAVLCEFERTTAETTPVAEALRACGETVVARSPEESSAWWGLRLGLGAAVAPLGPYKNDVAVPPSRLGEFLAGADALLRAARPGARLVTWGHLGDGNVHVNALKPDHLSLEQFAQDCGAIDSSLYALVRRCGGSISAEHGVGLTKKASLGYSRPEPQIALMRQIKRAFDPDGILNPGKIFDGE